MDLFTIKVINICKRCYRELKFEVKVDNSTSDYEIEVQSPLCPDCLKADIEEAIEKERKAIGDRVAEAFKKAMVDVEPPF